MKEKKAPETAKEQLEDCHFHMRSTTKQLSRLLSKIHDTTLPDATIRSINDQINMAIKERAKWEQKARSLGWREQDKTLKWNTEALPEPGNVHGYLYFGRAKELPGVKEFLQPKTQKRIVLSTKINEIQKRADAFYYGDELIDKDAGADGGSLIKIDWSDVERIEAEMDYSSPFVDWVNGVPRQLPPIPTVLPEPTPVKDHLPTSQEIEKFIVQEKKRRLLENIQETNEAEE